MIHHIGTYSVRSSIYFPNPSDSTDTSPRIAILCHSLLPMTGLRVVPLVTPLNLEGLAGEAKLPSAIASYSSRMG